MAFVASSGSPSRRMGMSATSFSVPGDRIAVLISPEEMAFTRNAAEREVGGPLAREHGERRLRGGVSGARERMHSGARDRAHIHHRSVRRFQLVDHPTPEHERREEFDLKHGLPVLERRGDTAEPRGALGLGRDRGVVDQRIDAASLHLQPPFISAMA